VPGSPAATAPIQLVVVPPSAGLARSGGTASNTAGRRSLHRANRSRDQEIRIMGSTTETDRGPVLLCYDGSDTAKRALEHAGHVLGGDELERWAEQRERRESEEQ
jgi:hypothetical protein